MIKLYTCSSVLGVMLTTIGARAAPPEEIAAAFYASLAAARAGAGNTHVNGTLNVLVEPPRRVIAGAVEAAPVVFVDPSDAVRRVNLVVRSPTRTIIEVDPDERNVALAPVMTRSQFESSKAALPLGAVVLPDRSIREIEVTGTTMLTGVVVRRR